MGLRQELFCVLSGLVGPIGLHAVFIILCRGKDCWISRNFQGGESKREVVPSSQVWVDCGIHLSDGLAQVLDHVDHYELNPLGLRHTPVVTRLATLGRDDAWLSPDKSDPEPTLPDCRQFRSTVGTQVDRLADDASGARS